jgi:hypothetical protein
MRSLGRIALLLNGLQAHILTDLLQALVHFLETLEFAQLFLRLGGMQRPVERAG